MCEITTMHADLQAKWSHATYSEVPAELMANSFANDMVNEKDKDGEPKEPKRQKRGNTNNWHPKLKQALTKPLADAGNPLFS